MNWFKQLFSRRSLYDDLSEEIQVHLEERIEELVAVGMSNKEATAAARREFGNLTLVQEDSREVWRRPSLEDFLSDIRFGARTLRKSLAFTAIAVLTLALGIGANTAIFILVNGILLVSLPYPKSEQLVSVTGAYPQGALVAMRERMHTMDVAAYAEGHDFNLTGRGEALRLTGTLVSAELFSILGAQPERGRVFDRGEDIPGRDSYVILSHALWQQRFGGDATMIGRSIGLEGVRRQVIGVMPADFRFPSTKTQIWIPLNNDPRSVFHYWAGDFMPVIGRLRPDATLQQARAEIRMFQSQASALFTWRMPASWNADVSVVPLQNGMVADVRVRLLLLLAAVALVLLSGRGFSDADVSGTPVAVVTTETARRFWPNQSALRKHIRLLDDKSWRTIVGVISDVRAYDLQRNTPNWIQGTAYVLYNPTATVEDRRVPSEMTIAIRTASDTSQIAPMLRDSVAALNHEVPVSEVKTMSAVVSEAVSAPASTTSLFVAFAALALLLGMIGIYGVLSFLVSQRTREIGVRIALGAQRGDVLYLVMKEGARFSFAGIAVGLTGAFLVTRLMSSELYGVSPLDPLTFSGVALVMAAVTLLACYLPTRRAMRVDPIVALRYE